MDDWLMNELHEIADLRLGSELNLTLTMCAIFENMKREDIRYNNYTFIKEEFIKQDRLNKEKKLEFEKIVLNKTELKT